MKYLVEVFWSEEDEAYVAVVPDLPGCSAVGETPEQAIHEIADAVEAWIEACRRSGDPMPPVATKPEPPRLEPSMERLTDERIAAARGHRNSLTFIVE